MIYFYLILEIIFFDHRLMFFIQSQTIPFFLEPKLTPFLRCNTIVRHTLRILLYRQDSAMRNKLSLYQISLLITVSQMWIRYQVSHSRQITATSARLLFSYILPRIAIFLSKSRCQAFQSLHQLPFPIPSVIEPEVVSGI